MLTVLTQAAITLLHTIATGDESTFISPISQEQVDELLRKLAIGGLICHLSGEDDARLSSYQLCRPLHRISILNVLTAIDEPIYCNHPLSESFYSRHRGTMGKLGIVNRMNYLFLEDIKLSDW